MFRRASPAGVPPAEEHWIQTIEELAQTFGSTAETDDAEARLPREHLEALSRSGLDRAMLPSKCGGEALSYATLGQVVRTLARSHPAVATLWLMHIGAVHALITQSEPDVAAHFAARLINGDRFANALSEPAGGNYFLNSQQDAEPMETGWSFSGRKMFVSGSEVADHLLLGARVEGEPAFFGVTVDQTLSFPPIDETAGMRATRSRSIVFTNTKLLESRRCGPPLSSYTNLITAAFAFISVGIAESALDALEAHAVSRRSPEGAVLADAGWVRSETGLIWARVEAARLMAERTMWLADAGSAQGTAAATESKLLANDVAKDAAALAVKVCGGTGYLMRSPVQRIFRDAQAGAIMAYSAPFASELVGGWMLSAEL
ncbi:acyl-CoA dehydrogenase family protein [Nesterenkonia halotolerans]|uniref:Alkylation response protein AidB-like acyl-CoA dehydrogenase n=1 Tax=Nesterenkonia halotolerans TaxID=225325 RepID=A0ABR9J667_9MICC|nr:acyl-CoA dehydrogenase family protein [Nesterenkonia halotolerans]MBE1514485.1 alkylation response protein AidB-like acyl-CoA dehydrogenase [Nesterenkonia halotolerans]